LYRKTGYHLQFEMRYAAAVADLEGVLRVPWNPTFKDTLVPEKSIIYLTQPDSECKAEKHAYL